MIILGDVSLANEQHEVVTQILGSIMSACSQRCYYAGWLNTTQDELPTLVEKALETRQPQEWGHGMIDLPTAITLKGLSLLLGHWANYDVNADSDHFVAYNTKQAAA